MKRIHIDNYKRRFFKKEELREISEINFSNFDNEIDNLLFSLKNKISLSKDKIDEQKITIPDLETKTTSDIIDFMNRRAEMYQFEITLQEINEMKIINLYKNVELSLKELVFTAYPDISKHIKKGLFRWDNLETFFVEKMIILKNLKGHKEINQLRNLNNNIKHSKYISPNISSIEEFREKDILDSDSVESFYIRVKKPVLNFVKLLSEKIIEDLYVFTDQRLNEIVIDYIDRMDIDDRKKLIERLKNTI